MNKNNFHNIILISLDCVRQEAISCYPNNFPLRKKLFTKVNTPNIDKIAKDGYIFTNAFCQAPATPASHASILTGLNPYNHGIRSMIGYRLSPKAKLLSERLKLFGYKTSAFVGSLALSREYGLNNFFDVYDDEFDGSSPQSLRYRRSCRETTDKALQWLSKFSNNNFFLFLHFFDAHDDQPLFVTEARKSGFRKWLYHSVFKPIDRWMRYHMKYLWAFLKIKMVSGKYYGIPYHIKKVNEIDIQIGKIIDYLENNNLYDKTIFVITSDHGDSFGAHGEYAHGEYLYDTTLKIPLIIKGQDIPKSKIITLPARSIDIYPTILGMLGIPYQKVDGVNLLDTINKNISKKIKIYSETRHGFSPQESNFVKKILVSLRTSNWKLIVNETENKYELYNIINDPNERNNLANKHSEVVSRIKKELDSLLKNKMNFDEKDMSENDLEIIEERLKGLGYL